MRLAGSCPSVGLSSIQLCASAGIPRTTPPSWILDRSHIKMCFLCHTGSFSHQHVLSVSHRVVSGLTHPLLYRTGSSCSFITSAPLPLNEQVVLSGCLLPTHAVPPFHDGIVHCYLLSLPCHRHPLIHQPQCRCRSRRLDLCLSMRAAFAWDSSHSSSHSCESHCRLPRSQRA
jgi:hypothetical protein